MLCKFGIEYVEDPATFKKIPTCHRTQLESVQTDVDYKAAIENADSIQRNLYESEAAEIDRLQRDILAIVHNEEPFDVFICYKETDENGKRTNDSVIANDIYHQLTQEGFKVFYAAITLEDKLGQAYEPYIFAALTSAKVMLVIGSKPEYFNAVWVKNEWSRYLKIMKNDRTKLLIPCYKDMDAYDLPEEFSHLQAQDMSKIGFINDIVRGIKKVVVKDEPKAITTERLVENGIGFAGNANIAPLLKRAFMFLEDKEWDSANEYAEKVLDIEPECAEAYLVKLMAELNAKTKDDLKNCAEPFDDKNNYKKAYKFGNDSLESELVEYNAYIRRRNENSRKEELYNTASKLLEKALREDECLKAKKEFESISDYKDSTEKVKECEKKAENCHKDSIYIKACQYISSETIESLNDAIKEFERIREWKDSADRIKKCKKQIEILEEEERSKAEEAEQNRIAAEKARKKKIMIATITTTAAVLIVSGFVVAGKVIIPNVKYNNAITLIEKGSYDEASEILTALGSYKNSKEKAFEAQYNKAIDLVNNGSYDEANEVFMSLNKDKESQSKITELLKLRFIQGKTNVGDKIYFGQYIWRVLDIQENSALIISDVIIEKMDDYEISEFLNNEIYDNFNDEEKSMIKDGQNDDSYKIFLLLDDDAEKYFSSKDDRVAYYKGESYWWWLSYNRYVDMNGVIRYLDTWGWWNSDRDYEGGVRPAMWIEF